jgi:pyridoxamine 5'-phosphate oxidase
MGYVALRKLASLGRQEHAEMDPDTDPIEQFARLFAAARESEPGDPTAFALATADADGKPTVRTVLLKAFDDRGFVFYTNYDSRKAHEIAENPRAAMCIYWRTIGHQVRVDGRIERISAAESDAYFAGRSRGSQAGAWASRQSEPLPSRRKLVGEYLKVRARYAGRPIPRPDFWGGYRLIPETIEFWSSKTYRLHDRYLFTRDDDGAWTAQQLYP